MNTSYSVGAFICKYMNFLLTLDFECLLYKNTYKGAHCLAHFHTQVVFKHRRPNLDNI